MTDIDYEEAMASLEAIGRNLSAGLMPVTGGRVSLMARPDVDLLFESNRGSEAGFVPQIPDSPDRLPGDRLEWYVAAIEQALFHGDPAFDAQLVSAMDGFLHTYLGEGVDWSRIHAFAAERDPTATALWSSPYWQSDSEPLSVLAFCGAQLRTRIAAAPTTPQLLLELMTADADTEVRQFATDNLRHARITVAATGAQVKEGSRRRIAVLASAVTAVVVSGVVALLVAIGLNNAYSFTVVDQEAHAATSRLVTADDFNLVANKSQLCKPGDDYTGCLNMHVVMYNSVCIGQSLAPAAVQKCTDLSRFIEDVRVRAAGCGYGCTTSETNSGLWGWSYLRLDPVSVSISNKDERPEISHEEHCHFELGPVELGNCRGRPVS